MLRVVEKPSEANQERRNTLDEVLQRGALKRLQEALEAEVDEYVARHRCARDARGRAPVVRNGQAAARPRVTGSGTLEVRAPRVTDQRVDAAGMRQRCSSESLPSDMRRAPKVTEVLPILYLRGLSTLDFQAARPVLLGEAATGLSPTTITRLTAGWETAYATWRARSVAEAEAGIDTFGGVRRQVSDGCDAALRRDQAYLLTFYECPAEHGRHLRTTNIIESPFATVRLRQRVTKGAGSRTKALMMAFKLLAMAEERWRRVHGAERRPLVRAGVRFVDGVQEQPTNAVVEAKESAA